MGNKPDAIKRSLGLERIYPIGPYQTLRVIDNISDLPEDLMLNKKFVNKVITLMLTNMESVNLRYNAMRDLLNALPTDKERLAYLEEQKTTTLDEIKTLLDEYYTNGE